jgi:hypothetical protein
MMVRYASLFSQLVVFFNQNKFMALVMKTKQPPASSRWLFSLDSRDQK